jgi:hypothetical protein
MLTRNQLRSLTCGRSDSVVSGLAANWSADAKGLFRLAQSEKHY